MGQANTIPRRINGVEGAAGQVQISGGPGVLESWGAPAPAAHVHAAGDVTSGQFPLARMPRAAAGNFLEGNGVAADPIFNALIAANIPNLDVAKITTGTFAVNRGGTGLNAIAIGGILYTAVANVLSRLAPGAANQVLRSTAANALQFAALLTGDIPALAASKITSGQFPLARMPRAATGNFLEGNGVGADPIYNALVEGNIPDHMSKNKLAFTLNKLLKGAGAGANPTEIDVPAAGKSIATGTYTGDGNATRHITVGFKCSMIIILNITDPEIWILIPNACNKQRLAETVVSTANTALHATDGIDILQAGGCNILNDIHYYWAISE